MQIKKKKKRVRGNKKERAFRFSPQMMWQKWVKSEVSSTCLNTQRDETIIIITHFIQISTKSIDTFLSLALSIQIRTVVHYCLQIFIFLRRIESLLGAETPNKGTKERFWLNNHTSTGFLPLSLSEISLEITWKVETFFCLLGSHYLLYNSSICLGFSSVVLNWVLLLLLSRYCML